MFTHVTPDEQLFSIVNSAESPSKLEPYPTLVGTAITGQLIRPPITLASAPSIPATTITTLACWSRGMCFISRWSPATPTSQISSVFWPIISAVTLASSATGMSAVPAVTIGNAVLEGSSSFWSRTMARAAFSYRRFGNSPVAVKASNISGSARVARTLLPLAARVSNILMIWSVVLPGQYMTSGKPRLICR